MPDETVSPDPSKGKMDIERVIMVEIDGKDRAVHGYDEILWKIRAGFIVILYGAITIISNTYNFPSQPLSFRTFGFVVLIFGFSASAFYIDWSFFVQKVRVIQARDELIGILADLVQRPDDHHDTNFDEIKNLLRNAGESRLIVDWTLRPSRVFLWVMYLGAPALATVAMICSLLD